MTIKLAAGLTDYWFTLDDDENDSDELEKPARFKLRGLTQIDLLEVMSEGEALSDGSFVPNHRGRLLLLRHGLVDWEGVTGEDGGEVKFSRAAANNLPAQVLGILANEILVRSVITDEEKKS
jgi:hypothetical protein